MRTTWAFPLVIFSAASLPAPAHTATPWKAPAAAGSEFSGTTRQNLIWAASSSRTWVVRRHSRDRGGAPIDGAIIGGAVAANAFGPYGYGYPYKPSYRYYRYGPYFEGYGVVFQWIYRR